MSENKDLEPVSPEESTGQEITRKKPGRPPGAKNKDTLFKELMKGRFQDIAEQNIQRTFEVLFEKAKDGDMGAIKLILDRVVPASKAIDLDAQAKKGGLTINVSIGDLEAGPVGTAEVIEDAEYEEIPNE